MKKTFVIGDIHGDFKALIQVLERANVQNGDRLIYLGDYVDGWSESAQLISFLIKIKEHYDCIFIKGNHDVWCYEWLVNPNEKQQVWINNGGRETILSYEGLGSEKQKHIDFFSAMKNFYVDEQNRLFIHAGFSSMKGPENEFYTSNYRWDRTLWEMAVVMDKRIQKHSYLYPKRLKLYKEIYIGHTPTLDFGSEVPMHKINVWNLDTGAAFTGRLSIMDMDTKQFWQSDHLPSLYPNEKGRNK